MSKRCLKCGSETVPDNARICDEPGCGGTVFGLPTVIELPPPSLTFNAELGGGGTAAPPPEQAVSSLANRIEGAPLAQMRRLLGVTGKKRPTVIAFFGFSRAGKSVFIMRTKDAGTELPYDIVKPKNPNPANLQERAQGIPIPGTSGIELHQLYDNKDDELLLVDIAGEEFKRAVEAGFKGGTDTTFLEYVAHADGFVFMLPAAETLHPNSWDEQNPHIAERHRESSQDHLQNLANCVTEVTLFLQFIADKTGNARTLSERDDRISKAVEEYTNRPAGSLEDLRLKNRVTQPALVLLSKADAYGRHRVQLERDNWSEQGAKRKNRNPAQLEKAAKQWEDYFDADPLMRLMCAESGDARRIVRAFHARFKTVRFDFATAIQGHEEYPEKDVKKHNRAIDLSKSHYGVAENLIWVRDEARRAKNPFSRVFNPGVGPAFALRKVIDADFRKRLGVR